MTVYRIDQPHRSIREEAFSGKGGLHAAGRWNELGTLIVYTASSLALACLETLVHLPRPRALSPRIYYRAEIPDHLVETLPDLPRHWSTYPANPTCQRLGTEWIHARHSPAAQVPSALLPANEPGNILLNPRHKKFDPDWIQGPFPFDYDSRLGSGQSR